MSPDRQSWPDIDGAPVEVGDWVEVFCTYTRQPKFDGRAVQVIEVLRGGAGSVFRIRDPSELEQPNFFVIADGHGYRRVADPMALN